MEEIITLSVIIPTRNRAQLLDKTLLSITKQTYSKSHFEVIVVDNGSTDTTSQVADKYKYDLNVVYVYEPKPGLHEGRHAGLKVAKSELLVYADDDIEAFPEWLETIFQVFQKDEKIVLVGGKNLPNFEGTPPFWIVEMWNKRCQNAQILGELSIIDFGNEEKYFNPMYVFGCNFSIRKQIVLDAGGFHPDGMPFELIRFRGDGETYISQYILDNNLKAFYSPKASVMHLVSKDRMTKEYFCKRRYSQGISDAFTHLRNKKEHKVFLKSESKFKKNLKVFLGLKQLEEIRQLKQLLKITETEKDFNISYQNGYDYLINCYNDDFEVKNWVHRDNYL